MREDLYYEKLFAYLETIEQKLDIKYASWALDSEEVPDLEVPHPFPVGTPIITDRMERFYAREWKRPYPKEIYQFLVPEGTYADLWKVLDDYMIFFSKFREYEGDLHGDHRFIEELELMTLPNGDAALSVGLGSQEVIIIYKMGEARERIREHKKQLDQARKDPTGHRRTDYTNAIMRWLYENTDLQRSKIAKLIGYGNSVMTRLIAKYYPEDSLSKKTHDQSIPQRKGLALTDEEFNGLLAFVEKLNQTS